MQIKPNEIHIWTADLAITQAQENENLRLLSLEERERADRYHFPIHRTRFIAARSMLRLIISRYLNITPDKIIFTYAEHEKPSLNSPNSLKLQFNLSHSENYAVYAITTEYAIGVDIEKIQDHFNLAVAKRFFTQQENADLLNFSSQEQTSAFYRIWARKEAVIKAIGKGLAIPLSSFSVSATDTHEIISFDHNQSWSLMPLFIHANYQSAVATNQVIKKISYWKFFDHQIKLDKVYIL
jgi:4'-phosphopantetheinyl transferase